MTKRKFKLIKAYPMLYVAKVGSVLSKNVSGDYYTNPDSNYSIHKNTIENFPEFWKEIFEKKYEILKLKFIRPNFYLHNLLNGEVVDVIKSPNKYINFRVRNTSDHYKDKEGFNGHIKTVFELYSLKRISDGEVFTIGDRVSKGVIKRLDLENEGYSTSDVGDWKLLKECVKVKPVFTTEDDVEIFVNDEYWWVNKSSYYRGYTSYAELPEYKNYLYFSTMEAAEEYILLNKPCLSINEVLESIETCTDEFILLQDVLKKQVKSKS